MDFRATLNRYFLVFLLLCAWRSAPAQHVDWSHYLGSEKRNIYSELEQINRDNVSQLKVAWTYRTGVKAEYQANNLIVDGILYTVAQDRRIIALNAATGEEIWIWDPVKEKAGKGSRRKRGLVFWRDEATGEARLFNVIGNSLFAIDMKTGASIRSFGNNGRVPLKTGLNTPGVVYKDKLIIGGRGGTVPARAFNVLTGELEWSFNLIPQPGEYGYDTWPEGKWETATGVTPWSGQALDSEAGIVYYATKTPTPDFYGADRHGDNLYGNCVLALNADTGERIWHFQTVHHDLLDRDLPCAPVLMEVMHEGKQTPILVQGTKIGVAFVFNRLTGEPLWPIEERAVPQTQLEGEQTSQTQPFPTKPAPLMRQSYTEADASNISPEAFKLTLKKIRESPNFGPYPAPSTKETVFFPGFDGGMEWGGGAATPDGMYFVNLSEIPWLLKMHDTEAQGRLERGNQLYLQYCLACHGMKLEGNEALQSPALTDPAKTQKASFMGVLEKGAGRMPGFPQLTEEDRIAIHDYILGYQSGELPSKKKKKRKKKKKAAAGGGHSVLGKTDRYAFGGFKKFEDREGYPGIKPPWGTLSAVDMNTGELKWQVVLGEYKELTARGLPPTGTINYGGPLATASGLLFIGATADKTFRVFDQENGEILWQTQLPYSGNATPSTYMVDGKQYVVISAGGGKDSPTGDALVAFALGE